MVVDRITLAEIDSVPSRPPDDDPHSWRPRSLVDLGLNAIEPPSIGGGLMYVAGRHIVSGEPESLKTWYAAVVAAEQIIAMQSVIWLDFEMGPRPMYERLAALGLTDEQIRDLFLYIEPTEALSADIRPEFEALLAVHKPSVAVIDSTTPALELHGFDPNKGQDIEAFRRHIIEPLRRCGAAVLMLDHLVKAKDNRGRFTIGSERKLGISEVHVSLQTIAPFGRGKTGRASITVHKDRHGHLARGKCAELELRSDAEERVTWNVRFIESAIKADEWKPTGQMERISMYLERCADPVSKNTVLDAIRGKTDYTREAIDWLIRDGYVEVVPGPRNSQLLRSLRPYREDLDGSGTA